MSKKISWKEIQANYSGRWVELTDYDWDWNKATPCSAIVKNASSNRNKLLNADSKESVILYVGTSKVVLGSFKDNSAQSIGL